MKAKLLLFLFSFITSQCMLAQVSTPPTTGDGSIGAPYEIETLENLYWISQNWETWGDGLHYIQTADIDASETKNWTTVGWKPIGNNGTTFNGTYNGQDYIISNLYIMRTASDYNGLFGNVEDATIKNLGLNHVDITGRQYTGGLVGRAVNTTIDSCYTNGAVTGTHSYTGGFAGNAYGSTLHYSYSACNVTGNQHVGGFIGSNSYGQNKNSFSLGVVRGTSNVGGFVGWNAANQDTRLCYSQSRVERISGTNYRIGSFAGYNTSGIIFSYATGRVIYSGATNPTNKGFIGDNSGTFQNNFFDTETTLQQFGTGATSRTTSQMMQEVSYTSWNFTTTWELVAGDYPLLREHTIDSVAPLGEGTIENPYQIATLQNIYWMSLKPTVWDKHFIQTSDIDASPTRLWFDGRGLIPIGTFSNRFSGTYKGGGHVINNLHISRPSQQNIGFFGFTQGAEITDFGLTNANITGYSHVGILVGRHGTTAAYTTLIRYCYTSGNAFGNFYTGGLAGYVSDAHIKDSYSMANANRLSGSNASFGSFAGHNDESSFIHNYSIGNTYYFNGTNPTDKAFIGSDQNTVTYEDNFIDSEVSNQNSAVGATAKTTVQMQNPETFSSWDFGIWLIDPAINDGYPYLLPYRALVQASAVENITATTAVTGGNVTDDNGYAVTQKGVVWSTLPNPTVDENEGITTDGADTGTYISNIENLDPGTEYYVRAYAINSKGNSYGEQLSFITAPSGSGTEIDPFQIGNLTQLKWMNHNEDHWDKHFIQIADINASPTASWNHGEGWKPIGYFIRADSFNYFTGSYDGQEYTIDSLFINNPDDYQGFFGYTKNATIKNMILDNIDFTGLGYLGGLVGICIDSEIENIKILSASINGDYHVGGISGRSITSTISLCQASGIILGDGYIGGLIGESITTSIDRSHSTCYVRGLQNIGGLVGLNQNNALILNSSSTSGEVTGNDVVGGLVGKNDNSRIENCYRTGDVSSSVKSSNSEMGGLVGANINGSIIKNAYSENGKVCRTGPFLEHYSISSVGGLAGTNSASVIINCHSTFDITHANDLVGGLVGRNTDGTISSSFATGNVKGKSSLGGLIGLNENTSIITNCYSRGKITIKEAFGYSATSQGGLVGSNSLGTIFNTYNTGGIYYEEFGIPNPTSKGMVGVETDGLYSSNFFNSTLSNQTSSTGAIAISSELMQLQETFAGWDFSNIWTFETGVNDEFPIINAADLPVVVITGFMDTTVTTNTISADVRFKNGSDIIALGMVWDTVPNADITNNIGKSNEATDDTSFVAQIDNLLPGKTYYARPYAENSEGTAYGNEVMFITEGTAPSITTKSITNITETSALGGGIITTDGGSPIAARGIVWGTNPNPTLETNEGTVPGTTETADFECPLTGLTPNATYYVRAYATNGEGTGYGNEVQFSTAVDLPTLTTKSITSITDNSAMGGGIINSNGGSAITARGIAWGTSNNPTLETNEGTSAGTSKTADFDSPITGLTPNTTYYVRAYATNAGGTGYGNELTFSTVEMHYTLTFVSSSSEGGIASLAAGQTEGPFPAGALVNIQAIANEGYQFVEWTLNGVTISTEAEYTYTMPAENISLTAVFSIANNIDISSLHNVSVYPNPFYDQIYLKNVTGKLKVEVTNIQGHKIYVKQLIRNYKINTSQLVPGIYFIRLEFSDGQSRVLRMTKQ